MARRISCISSCAILAIVFGIAAASKALDPGTFTIYISQIRFIPEQLVVPLVYAIPAGELALATLLALPATRKMGFIAAIVTLSTFTLFLMWAVYDPTLDSCKCMELLAGPWTATGGERWGLVRNAFLLIVATAGFLASSGGGARVAMGSQMYMAVPGSPQQARSGFTLLELLVVIGIIGLLLAILLPVLSAARRSARSAVCLSNLRQVGILSVQWSADHRNTLPLDGEAWLPPGTAGYNGLPSALNDPDRSRYAYVRPHWTIQQLPTGESPVPFHVALAALAADVDPVELQPFSDWDRVRERGLGVDFLHCPEARHLRTDADLPRGTSSLYTTVDGLSYANPWWTTISYATNGGLLGFHYNPRFHARRYGGLLSRVTDSSRMVVSGDGNDLGAVWLPTLRGTSPTVSLQDIYQATPEVVVDPELWSKADLGRPRHSGGHNVLFVDGHARLLRPGASGAGYEQAMLLQGPD